MVDLNAVDSSKKRVEYDSKIKTSVRNMRIREDTAHYLLHLDDDAAYYGPFPFFSFSLPDPRTRSMRGGQAEFAQKRTDYAGESFVRASSEVQDFRRTQQFAWEASQKGSSVHVEAQPTATGGAEGGE